MAGGLKLRLPAQIVELPKLGAVALRSVTLGNLRVPTLTSSSPDATLRPSGTPDSSPGDAFRIFPDPSIVPVAPLDFGARFDHFLETILGPNTLLGRAVRAPLWVAMMGIPGGGVGPSLPQSAEGQCITENVQVMLGGGAAMRAAAQVVLDFAQQRSEAFTPDHLAGIIEVSARAAPTWFGNRALQKLAIARRDLFTDDIVAQMRAFNEAPETTGCFQLALEALDKKVPPQPAAPFITAWPGVGIFRRPAVPELIFPPKPDPIK